MKKITEPDSVELANLLDRALADGEKAFLDALMMAVKKAGIGAIAKDTGIRRESLHRYNRSAHRPQFKIIIQILRSLGTRLRVEPREEDGR
jgi:probable addiction module antidote protein